MDRLTLVEQNYFRNETISQANAVLIEYLSTLNSAKLWGSGKVASADGISFIVPPKTIYAGSNPKHFGIRHGGITSYDLISDQFGGLNRVIFTGTMRDSLSLIEVVLGQTTHIDTVEQRRIRKWFYVAQALCSNGYSLYYWESNNTAEIDFVIQKENAIIPIEVKAGSNTRSRSLSVYSSKY